MKTVAFHTLGCRVNQYDSQAMLERFLARGYTAVPFTEEADVYVINTCTVTGTGDRKSMQLARRVRREHPGAQLVLCGCLAQRLGAELLSLEPRLILGTHHREKIVELLEQAVRENRSVCEVSELASAPFEPLRISSQAEHTRCDLKIQEGCDNHCTYCVIPSVRGPVRSRPIPDIAEEAERLVRAGYHELVVTGIHLTSYGRDLPGRPTLLDALAAIQAVPGVWRIRLGSLEPVIATESFSRGLARLPAVCPQFHLALQSGSDTVLARMARRYNTAMYRKSVDALRAVFPRAAFTTDILTGFPGENEAEFQETLQMIREIGFARIHVFPFSPREGTKAASMPGQLSRGEKERRARLLIQAGKETAEAYMREQIGRTVQVLPEDQKDGIFRGYTPEYIAVYLRDSRVESGKPVDVRLTGLFEDGMLGNLVPEGANPEKSNSEA